MNIEIRKFMPHSLRRPARGKILAINGLVKKRINRVCFIMLRIFDSPEKRKGQFLLAGAYAYKCFFNKIVNLIESVAHTKCDTKLLKALRCQYAAIGQPYIRGAQ